MRTRPKEVSRPADFILQSFLLQCGFGDLAEEDEMGQQRWIGKIEMPDRQSEKNRVPPLHAKDWNGE
jgi:hypothetical protein